MLLILVIIDHLVHPIVTVYSVSSESIKALQGVRDLVCEVYLDTSHVQLTPLVEYLPHFSLKQT